MIRWLGGCVEGEEREKPQMTEDFWPERGGEYKGGETLTPTHWTQRGRWMTGSAVTAMDVVVGRNFILNREGVRGREGLAIVSGLGP